MSSLKEGESVTTRRLQARAAKSAVRRAQEIYDAAAARNELSGIQDATERSRRAKQLEQETNTEINFLAKRLSELIPTHSSLDDTTKLEEFYDRPASTYTTANDEQQPRKKSVVEQLVEEQAKRRPHQSATEDSYDEFVDAWFNQKPGVDDKQGGENDGDDVIETILV
jgi:hypothetical protein